jgi:membrane protease YdiL (CAAX protease family)
VKLTKRESRIAWGFLFGVTLSEAVAVAWTFQPGGSWVEALWRYCGMPPGTATAWLLAAGVIALYVGYAASRSPVIKLYAFAPASWASVMGLRLFAVPMAFVTGFFEEAFFRKSVMDIAEHHGYGGVLQVIISAVVFGVAHAIWGVFGGKFRAALAVMIATTILGGLLAVVYLVGGRSIGSCIAAHIGINLFLEPWMVISSATGSWGKRSVRG